jgi:hypothetical protein
MNRKAIAAGAAALCTLSAPAAAQAPFSIRNDTRQNLSCGLQRIHGSINDLFVLRPGATWTHPAGNGSQRRLRCDVNRLPLRVWIRPGIAYSLGDNGRGSVVLRVTGAGSRDLLP